MELPAVTPPGSGQRHPAKDSFLLSVVIPFYNEEQVIPELIRRVTETVTALGIKAEMVLVNDGSTDQTLPLLLSLSRVQPELRIINLTRNFGHMEALSAGMAAAKGDAMVILDGDLQDPPELIGPMLEEWRRGADIVLGLRTERRESLWQRAGTAFFYWFLAKFARIPIPTNAGTFSLMNRWVAQQILRMPERRRFFAGLRAWTGGRIAHVEYKRLDRPYQKSRVGLRGLISLARTAIISFTTFPLRLASALALLSGLILFGVGAAAIVIRAVTNLAIPGWATYTTMIGMMGFVQSLLLAVISEYLAVIFDEIKARPIYLVREEFRSGERRAPSEDPVPPEGSAPGARSPRDPGAA